MPDDSTFAEQMVSKIETLLLANPGVQSVSVDGTSVSYTDLMQQYEFWKSKVARESGTRPRSRTIDLSGF